MTKISLRHYALPFDAISYSVTWSRDVTIGRHRARCIHITFGKVYHPVHKYRHCDRNFLFYGENSAIALSRARIGFIRIFGAEQLEPSCTSRRKYKSPSYRRDFAKPRLPVSFSIRVTRLARTPNSLRELIFNFRGMAREDGVYF